MINFLSVGTSANVFLILLIIALFFFCLYLFLQNKKLKERIVALEVETKEILERKIIKGSREDLVPIQKISTEQTKEEIPLKQPQKQTKENKPSPKQKIEYAGTYPKKKTKEVYIAKKNTESQVPIDLNPTSLKQKPSSTSNVISKETRETLTSDINFKTNVSILDEQLVNENQKFKESQSVITDNRIKNSKETTTYNSKAYQKNVFQNHNTVTSPVRISNQETFDIDKLSFDLNEFIKKSEKVVPKIKEQTSKKDYLKEISDKMANELKPQTIELTDYEKAQEEHAIISYQELLSVKDKLKIADDEEGTIDFIEELKKLRNSLN